VFDPRCKALRSQERATDPLKTKKLRDAGIEDAGIEDAGAKDADAESPVMCQPGSDGPAQKDSSCSLKPSLDDCVFTKDTKSLTVECTQELQCNTLTENLKDAHLNLIRALAMINFLRFAQIVCFMALFSSMMWPMNHKGTRHAPWLWVWTAVSVLIAFVVVGLVWSVPSPPDEANLFARLGADKGVGVVVGVLEAASMGAFIGRLETRSLGVHKAELAVLYLYVGIQPLFSTLRLHGRFEDIEVVIKVYALISKALLCCVVCRLLACNRVRTYMARVDGQVE
jgi:hypothetical protein